MKLVTLAPPGASHPCLGAIVGGQTLNLSAAAEAMGLEEHRSLATMEAYLQGLPGTQALAQGLVDRGLAGEFEHNQELWFKGDATLLAPVTNPPVLLDFGLTPKHLGNAAHTLLKRELGGVIAALVSPIVKWRLSAMSTGDIYPYYKGNNSTVIGPGGVLGWPDYTSYLDIEPELGVIVGGQEPQIAGYVIFNDASARDIQLPEMFGTGPARSKDFDRGNGVGPWLVTPDEISDPLGLKVDVRVGDRIHWEGHTSEYSRRPQEVLDFVKGIFTPPPGTLLGLGTVPDTTGLDRDEWLEPGDEVHISFDGLGTLIQRFPRDIPPLREGRWGKRSHPLIHYIK